VSRRSEAMRDASTEQLYADIQEYGALAVTLTRDELKDLGVPTKRAERLRSWVRKHGSLDPRRKGTPIPEPRAERRGKGGEKWMVVGDVHVAPGQSYRRLGWLGKMAADLGVTKLIQGGDWSSFDSQCTARPLRERVRDRLKDELIAIEISVGEFEHAAPKGMEKVVIPGNHDERPDKLANDNPTLEDLFDVWEHHRAAGWHVGKYLEPYESEGWAFVHYLTGRGTQRAIAGKFHPLRLLERVKYQTSICTFHSHRLQWWMERGPIRTTHGLVAGCYLEHREDYAGPDNEEWWSGAIVMNNVRQGDADLEFWSIDRIRETYG
jgi:hypothetical protein